jgi:hypothetical protein
MGQPVAEKDFFASSLAAQEARAEEEARDSTADGQAALSEDKSASEQVIPEDEEIAAFPAINVVPITRNTPRVENDSAADEAIILPVAFADATRKRSFFPKRTIAALLLLITGSAFVDEIPSPVGTVLDNVAIAINDTTEAVTNLVFDRLEASGVVTSAEEPAVEDNAEVASEQSTVEITPQGRDFDLMVTQTSDGVTSGPLAQAAQIIAAMNNPVLEQELQAAYRGELWGLHNTSYKLSFAGADEQLVMDLYAMAAMRGHMPSQNNYNTLFDLGWPASDLMETSMIATKALPPISDIPEEDIQTAVGPALTYDLQGNMLVSDTVLINQDSPYAGIDFADVMPSSVYELQEDSNGFISTRSRNFNKDSQDMNIAEIRFTNSSGYTYQIVMTNEDAMQLASNPNREFSSFFKNMMKGVETSIFAAGPVELRPQNSELEFAQAVSEPVECINYCNYNVAIDFTVASVESPVLEEIQTADVATSMFGGGIDYTCDNSFAKNLQIKHGGPSLS